MGNFGADTVNARAVPAGQLAALPARGILRVAGPDRRNFLQGLVSNDVTLCQPATPVYAGFLTPQGKFLHDLFIIDGGSALLIDCEKARADDLLARLQRFRLRAKVDLDNVSDSYEVWATWDAQSAPRAEGEKAKAPPSTTAYQAPLESRLWSNNGVIFVDPRLSALGERMVVRKGSYPYQSPTADADAYDRHRLRLGVPDGTRDLGLEKATLLDGNFDCLHGISWTKGCYMGQELTARMHYRALIKKRLIPVTIKGPAPPATAILTLADAEAGEMRSSNSGCGLALLNLEKTRASLNTGTPLICGEAELTPAVPGWLKL